MEKQRRKSVDTLIMNRKTGAALVVDDVDIMRITCQRALERAGYSVVAASSGLEALKVLESNPVEVAVLDIRMPGISGVDLLKKIKDRWPETEVIMMTAYADAEMAEESLKMGASALLRKPFEDINVLVEAVKRSMARVRFKQGKSADKGNGLEEALLSSKLLNADQLAEAKKLAEDKELPLRQALIEIGAASADQLDWAVAEYLEIPYVRITEKMLDQDLIKNFPPRLARAYNCLPLFRSGEELHLVIGSAFPAEAAETIARALELKPVLSIGDQEEIRELIEKLYGPSQSLSFSELAERLPSLPPSEQHRLAREFLLRSEFIELEKMRIAPGEAGDFELEFKARLRARSGK